MQEQEARFRLGELEPAGTIVLPGQGGPFPGVLFITGSGQVHRNDQSSFCQHAPYLHRLLQVG